MSLFKTRAGPLLISLFAFVQLSHAAELRSARVTQIINDVKLLPGQATARAEIVHGGEMTMMTLDGQITRPTKFNAALVYKTSKLITSFPPLANADLILAVIAEQQAELAQQSSSPPVDDSIDKRDQATTASTIPASGGAKFGPPTAIPDDPYHIISGTVINTDPTITTNGITHF